MSLLPKPLSALLSTAISALAGWITVLIAEHAPFIHVTHDQVVAGILFAIGTLVHAAHVRGWDRFITGRVTKLEAVAEPYVGNAGFSAIEKEVVALVGKVDALIGLHGAAPAKSGNASTGGGVTVAVTDIPAGKPASKSSATR